MFRYSLQANNLKDRQKRVHDLFRKPSRDILSRRVIALDFHFIGQNLSNNYSSRYDHFHLIPATMMQLLFNPTTPVF